MGKHTRRVVAVIPAHNEQATVGHTVTSLKDQTIPPDRVLVVSDNSTDHTVQAARDAGADPMVTTGNTHKKAGALNQALATLNLTAGDLVLIMDADTIMVPGWIERALVELQDPRVGAVGAVFQADTDRGWLRGCQAREWHRYGVQIARTGKTFVLSGTAALIRWEALQDVRRVTGNYYDPSALTEDFVETVNLLNAGWLLRSPVECETTTETMGTVPELIAQRTRWSRGGLQCVTRQGLTRVTRVYWWQQLMLFVAILVGVAAYALTVTGWALYGPRVTWYAGAILTIFWLERVVTVWGMGWRHRLVAALMVPELAYAWILQLAHLKAIWQHFTNAAETWHLNDKETPHAVSV